MDDRLAQARCFFLSLSFFPRCDSSLSYRRFCPFQDVIKLETQYWTLVDIPRQEKQETVPAFVLRACSIMEKTHKSGEGVKTSARLAEEAETKRERIERLESEYSECGNRLLSRVVIVAGFAEGRKQFSIVLPSIVSRLCRSLS